MLELGISSAALALILAIFLIRYGKNKQSAHSANSSNHANHNSDSHLRVRSTPGMDTIRQQQSVESRKIKGSYTLVEKATGNRFHAWKVPDDRLSVLRLNNTTAGNIQLLYTEGGMDPFVIYRKNKDSPWGLIYPGQILIYREASGEFRVLNWETDRYNFDLEI